MSEFNPSMPTMVHDQLNDDTFEWVPEKWREHYQRYASEHTPGIVAWESPARWLAAHALELSCGAFALQMETIEGKEDQVIGPPFVHPGL
jgi:hypothetical protein